MEADWERFRRVLIIGDSQVGKTSILLRFTNDTFHPSHITTLGVDIRTRVVEVDGISIKLQLWDTAGQEKFHTITRTFYKDADAIVLAYDISNKQTFNNIMHWLSQIQTHAGPNLVLAMIANKIDLPQEQRQVSLKEGQDLAAELNVPFLETSALSNTNIDEIFTIVARNLIQRDTEQAPQQRAKDRASKLEPAKKKEADKKKKCC